MKILITGGAGFVGTNLAIDLTKQGHEVYCFDNYITGKRENQQKYVKYYNIDVDKKINLNYLKEPDLIFHLAAESHVDRSIDSPYQFIHSNILGTFNILEAIRENNKKSSNQIYNIGYGKPLNIKKLIFDF